ncbi:MAG: 16S rRNA (cytosine(967)-C(5))-methyltransferase RsmB [Planctomycetia bacterium]|nr:16S rRNA (cytosine(967)-C(5))-methyltransferase RsmB [Planctomycetia bacterium]
MKPAVSPRFGGQHGSRSLALQVLLDCQPGQPFAQELLDTAFTTHRAPHAAADRRMATQLVYGVLRRRGTLDALLQPLVSRPQADVEPWLWDILRLGAFQLSLLDHVPLHAAMNETVELAAQFGRPQAKGFINGVLRNFLSLLTDEFGDTPASNALPVEPGRYRRLTRAVLPDPASQRVQYLAGGFSLPSWLVERWLPRLGWDECIRLGFWFAGQAPLWLRVNRLKTNRTDFLAALAGAGLKADVGDNPDAVRLTTPTAIRDLPGYAEGWFSVQDESATNVAAALAPTPGSRVLDLCAAPGGKTTHLAEQMDNRGEIIACDVDERRLQTVRELCSRLGIGIVQTVLLQETQRGRWEAPPAGPFDFILVDVPCSNTGVLGRRPEARWRLKRVDLVQLETLQVRLLRCAAERIRPGGTIVYSTCSIEPGENGQLVRRALQDLPELQLEAEQEQMPGAPADGGYWARLRRK